MEICSQSWIGSQSCVKSVKLFGEEIAVRAEIASLKGTSGHADEAGLLAWLDRFEQKPKTVFLNHGTEESIAALGAKIRERDMAVEAPYSGTEYDLLTGRMTAYCEQKRLTAADVAKNRARKNSVHADLISAAEALLALAKRADGRPNKDNAKLTAQIRSLIEKWR